jgi:adenylate cyclase
MRARFAQSRGGYCKHQVHIHVPRPRSGKSLPRSLTSSKYTSGSASWHGHRNVRTAPLVKRGQWYSHVDVADSLPVPAHRPDRIPLPTSLAVVALLIAVGWALSFVPATGWIDLQILDAKFRVNRALAPKPATDSIVIVGIDEATLASIPEPVALWHRQFGRAFTALAGANPRAVGLDVILPDRSFDFLAPGADQALITGLLALRRATALAVGLRTTEAGEQRAIHAPLLAAAGDDADGLVLWPFDIDNHIRRFDERLGEHDEYRPTLVGRLAAKLGVARTPGILQYALGNGFDYVPLKTLLDWADRGDAAALKQAFGGSIVLIGDVLPLEDRFHQPVRLARWENTNYVPGVLIHAQALRSLLAGEIVRYAPPWAELMLMLLAASLWFIPSWRVRALAFAAMMAGAFGVSLMLLNAGIELPLGAALRVALTATALRSAIEAWALRKDRARLKALFGGYVSPEVLDALISGELDADTGRRSALCFLFADIRNFTTYSEAAPPERALAMLNRYYAAMTPILHAHGGTVDNFRGDGLMTIFGAPNPLPNPAVSGLAAARAMLDRLEALNTALATDGLPRLDIGVTLAYGEAVVGNVGSADRHNYTAIGDAVNVAARLQDVAKALDYPLIASAAVVEHAGENGSAGLTPLGEQSLRGRRAERVFGWRARLAA